MEHPDEIVRLLRCIRSLLFGVGLMLFALGILAFGLMFTQGTPIFGVIFYGSALLFLLAQDSLPLHVYSLIYPFGGALIILTALLCSALVYRVCLFTLKRTKTC